VEESSLRANGFPTAGGNVPTLRSRATSAGRRHESGCGTRAPAAGFKV